MNETRDTDEIARSVFRGLVPHTVVDDAARRERQRLARGVRHTVPILLVGSMAASMLNVTGPIESAQARPPVKPRADTSDLGKVMRESMANSSVTVAPVQAAPVEAAVATTAPATYRVQAGDTVSDIAGRFGLSTASVLALNGLGWSSLIHPGQELKLSSGASAPAASDVVASGQYTIAAGDTISAIADRFGVSTFSVLAANGLGWESIIYPGQTLVIPGGSDPAQAPPAPVTQTEQPDESPIDNATDDAPIATVPVVNTAPIAEEPVAGPAPVGGNYTIVSGDTISGIAARFGISTQALLDANGLTISSVIFAGGTLVIPGLVAAVPASVTAPAPAGDGSITPLNDEMRANAAVIVQVGRELGVSDYGIVIALATAMQESSLRNLTWGDLDSVGLFQQRPSSGWGTVEELTDARHATYTFFHGRAGYTRGLLDIRGWESMPLTVAAQTVQISAYPDAYAKWESSAWAWLAELG